MALMSLSNTVRIEPVPMITFDVIRLASVFHISGSVTGNVIVRMVPMRDSRMEPSVHRKSHSKFAN